jgi:hypothetical protein
MTTSLNHPIKVVGLKKVYEKLTKNDYIDYYFVVLMELFDRFKEQIFVTSKGNKAKIKAPWFNCIKQYVLGIDLSLKFHYLEHRPLHQLTSECHLLEYNLMEKKNGNLRSKG